MRKSQMFQAFCVSGKIFFLSTTLVLPVIFNLAHAAVSKESLSQEYINFYNAKNCDAIISLFYTQDVQSEMLATLKMNACDFSYKIKSVKFSDPDPIMTNTFQHNGKTFEPTLKAQGVIDFEYEQHSDGTTGSSLPYGQKNGVYHFVTSREVKK